MNQVLNPLLEVGDEVICYHMEGEMTIRPGLKGTVIKIQEDPIVPDTFISSKMGKRSIPTFTFRCGYVEKNKEKD